MIAGNQVARRKASKLGVISWLLKYVCTIHAAEQQLLAKWVNTQFSFRVRGAFAAALFIIFLARPKGPPSWPQLACWCAVVAGCSLTSTNVYHRQPCGLQNAVKRLPPKASKRAARRRNEQRRGNNRFWLRNDFAMQTKLLSFSFIAVLLPVDNVKA